MRATYCFIEGKYHHTRIDYNAQDLFPKVEIVFSKTPVALPLTLKSLPPKKDFFVHQ
jgi:hypothetical protein